MEALFGYVTASMEELTPAQKGRWGSVYCGICRRIGQQSSQISRAVLGYDCAFLALLLMSLYEPPETAGESRCLAHPLGKKPWVDNEYIRYAADMNVALGYYKALDDQLDDHKLSGRVMAAALKKNMAAIQARYPRQCAAIEAALSELSRLEKENSRDIDGAANCFGRLLSALFVYREDLWAPTLERIGFALGRFIYLADALCDLDKDKKAGLYNPYLAAGVDPQAGHGHLVMAMAACSDYFERLPLVQDKEILDNIIYSGVWTRIRLPQEENHA